MSKLKKKDLVDFMHSGNSDYHKYEYTDMLECFMESIEELIKQGHEVNLERFGTFKPKVTKPIETMNVRTKEREMHTGSTGIKFTPAVTLQQRVKAYYKEIKNELP